MKVNQAIKIHSKTFPVDTIRLILLLECNLSCSYCCNNQSSVNSKFIKMKFEEIDFSKYKNVCITGGEPFLYKDFLYSVLLSIPKDKNIYLYTNGLLINHLDIMYLSFFGNLKGINIGLHSPHQFNRIIVKLQEHHNVRYMINEKYYQTLLDLHPDRLSKNNLKSWETGQCEMPNEDWILLKESAK